MIGTLLWGRGGRKRLVKSNRRLKRGNKHLFRRVAALEAKASMPAINQIVNFNAEADSRDNERQLREAIEAKTAHGLKETISRLPQISLGDNHSYVQLPDGTNIVSMADGSIRLALPIPLSVSFQGSLDGSLSATVEHGGNTDLSGTQANWRASPGAGQLAAKLIVTAPTLDEAREIWSAFYSASSRRETRWAYWAFITRLEEAGRGNEVYDLAFELAGNREDIDPDEEMEAELQRWRERR